MYEDREMYLVRTTIGRELSGQNLSSVGTNFIEFIEGGFSD